MLQLGAAEGLPPPEAEGRAAGHVGGYRRAMSRGREARRQRDTVGFAMLREHPGSRVTVEGPNRFAIGRMPSLVG
jgi:hypothetical protein